MSYYDLKLLSFDICHRSKICFRKSRSAFLLMALRANVASLNPPIIIWGFTFLYLCVCVFVFVFVFFFFFNNHNCPELIPKRLHPSNYGLRPERQDSPTKSWNTKNHENKIYYGIMKMKKNILWNMAWHGMGIKSDW